MHLTLGFLFNRIRSLFIVSINFTYRSIKPYSSIVFYILNSSPFIYISGTFLLFQQFLFHFFLSWVWLFTRAAAGEWEHEKRVDCWVLGNVVWTFCAVHPTIAAWIKKRRESIYLYFMIFPNRLCTPASHSDVASAFDGHWYWYKNWQ